MYKVIITAILLGLTASASVAQDLIHVEKSGKGQPLILIHGLYSGAGVWEETIRHYQNQYECHAITLAGFDGKAAALKEPFLDQVSSAIVEYMEKNKLSNALVMGHSMGAFLSIWVAAKAPNQVAGVVAVDGLPFLTAIQIPGATPESAKPMATNMRNMMGSASAEQTYNNQKMYLPSMIRNPEKVELVAQMAKRSDAKTIGQVLYEMYTTDLRETISEIKAPVLVLGAWVGYKDYGATREATLALYEQQYKNVKNCKIIMSDTARHFIFFDEPEWFLSQTGAFFKSL